MCEVEKPFNRVFERITYNKYNSNFDLSQSKDTYIGCRVDIPKLVMASSNYCSNICV